MLLRVTVVPGGKHLFPLSFPRERSILPQWTKARPSMSLGTVTIWVLKAMFSGLSTSKLTLLFSAVFITCVVHLLYHCLPLITMQLSWTEGYFCCSVPYFQGLKLKLGRCSINMCCKYFRLSWNQTVLPVSRTRASPVGDKDTGRGYYGEPPADHWLTPAAP